MLHGLGNQAVDCLRKAEECRRAAETASDALTRLEFLDMEGRRLKLAESYQFSDRISRWLN